QDRRRRAAALGDRWVELGSPFVVVETPGAAMDDPDIVLLVDPDADSPAEQPVVGKRFWPQRIDHEARRLHRRALRFGLALQDRLADAQARDGRHQRRARDEFAPKLDHGRLPLTPRLRADERLRHAPHLVAAIIGDRTGLVRAIGGLLTYSFGRESRLVFG